MCTFFPPFFGVRRSSAAFPFAHPKFSFFFDHTCTSRVFGVRCRTRHRFSFSPESLSAVSNTHLCALFFRSFARSHRFEFSPTLAVAKVAHYALFQELDPHIHLLN